MDSKSGRLPFVSSSRSSYTSPSSYSASSSSLSSSRLYGRERLLSSDRFPRSTTSLKPEPDLKVGLVNYCQGCSLPEFTVWDDNVHLILTTAACLLLDGNQVGEPFCLTAWFIRSLQPKQKIADFPQLAPLAGVIFERADAEWGQDGALLCLNAGYTSFFEALAFSAVLFFLSIFLRVLQQ